MCVGVYVCERIIVRYVHAKLSCYMKRIYGLHVYSTDNKSLVTDDRTSSESIRRELSAVTGDIKKKKKTRKKTRKKKEKNIRRCSTHMFLASIFPPPPSHRREYIYILYNRN